MPRSTRRAQRGGLQPKPQTRRNLLLANSVASNLPSPSATKASAQLASQLMQNPEVVSALANLAAAGVHVGADVIEKSLPDLQKAAAATGTSLKAAAVNAIQGVIDAIPIADDIEAVFQELLAVADVGGAAAKAGTGALYSLKDIMATLNKEGTTLNQRVQQLQEATDNALPPANLETLTASAGAARVAAGGGAGQQQQPKRRKKVGGKRRLWKNNRLSKRRRKASEKASAFLPSVQEPLEASLDDGKLAIIDLYWFTSEKVPRARIDANFL